MAHSTRTLQIYELQPGSWDRLGPGFVGAEHATQSLRDDHDWDTYRPRDKGIWISVKLVSIEGGVVIHNIVGFVLDKPQRCSDKELCQLFAEGAKMKDQHPFRIPIRLQCYRLHPHKSFAKCKGPRRDISFALLRHFLRRRELQWELEPYGSSLSF